MVTQKRVAACLIGSALMVGILNFNYESAIDGTSLRGQLSPSSSDTQQRLAIGAPSLKIPPSLDIGLQRRLSLNLGGGICRWEAPEYTVPTNLNFYKTLIAGFPSCDKRMTFTQMEALTGWPARDEWDFVFYGSANHPFIKSNYPHHEGYWSWGDRADQVIMVVRNMRRTMVEYHDILWDIASAKVSNLNINDVLYRYRPPIDSFFEWRDLRVMDEIQWYGWFIDYWMEGGLRRDVFQHELTSAAAWPYAPKPIPPPACLDDPWHPHKTRLNTCSNSGVYNSPTFEPTHPPTRRPTRQPTSHPTKLPTLEPTEWPTPNGTGWTFPPTDAPVPEPSPSLNVPTLDPPEPVVPPPEPVQFLFPTASQCCQNMFPNQQCFLENTCVTPSPTPPVTATYDPHCANNEIANGCEPVAIISAEKLRDLNAGKDETRRIAEVLTNRVGISEYLIAEEAWDCIWTELIPLGKGNRMVEDRIGYVEDDYNFSAEMLQSMNAEYNRLITKYSASSWSVKPTAIRLVQLLMEHRSIIQMELNDVLSGARMLTDRDFLGPVERNNRQRLKAEAEGLPEEDPEQIVIEKKKHFEYFMNLEDKVKTTRRVNKARERQEGRLRMEAEKRLSKS